MANPLVTPESSVMVYFFRENVVEFNQELCLIELVSVDFAFDLLVLGDCLFHAVLCENLRVATVVDVIKDLEWYLNVTGLMNLMTKSFNFL